MAFKGIPVAALDFYEDLEDDNSKAFWTAHKSIYDESVKAPLEELIAELSPKFGPAKLFRPYRDVRFAKDKTPYKTHQGAWFGESSMYMHISAAGLFVAAGYWQTASDQVTRMRLAIADDIVGAQLERDIKKIRAAKFTVDGEQLSRVPTGFAKDHPRADLLRHKTLVAHREVGAPAWLHTARAKSEITKAWTTMAPLRDWLQTHVGPSEIPAKERR